MTTNEAYVAPARKPATWQQAFIAAVVTWALTWVVGLIFGNELAEGPKWLDGMEKLSSSVGLFLTGLLYSGAVSWVPLLILMPFVRWVDGRTAKGPLIGLSVGAVVGAGLTALFLPPFLAPWGAAIGAMMGALNFLVLRNMRLR